MGALKIEAGDTFESLARISIKQFMSDEPEEARHKRYQRMIDDAVERDKLGELLDIIDNGSNLYEHVGRDMPHNHPVWRAWVARRLNAKLKPFPHNVRWRGSFTFDGIFGLYPFLTKQQRYRVREAAFNYAIAQGDEICQVLCVIGKRAGGGWYQLPNWWRRKILDRMCHEIITNNCTCDRFAFDEVLQFLKPDDKRFMPCYEAFLAQAQIPMDFFYLTYYAPSRDKRHLWKLVRGAVSTASNTRSNARYSGYSKGSISGDSLRLRDLRNRLISPHYWRQYPEDDPIIRFIDQKVEELGYL